MLQIFIDRYKVAVIVQYILARSVGRGGVVVVAGAIVVLTSRKLSEAVVKITASSITSLLLL